MMVSEPPQTLSPWADLIGEWDMESPIFDGGRGVAVFEWHEGKQFVALRSTPPSPAPASVWLIGADDSQEDCTALYSDDRGVSRVYTMRLGPDGWTATRFGEPFSQKFESKIDLTEGLIRGAWFSSSDHGNWKHDFDLVYRRRPKA